MSVKVRVITTLLVLLFSMCGAQTRSTQTEVQTENQSTGAAAAAVTTELDISAELRELRDMVVKQATILEQLRVTQTFFQGVLQSTTSLMYKVESENNDQQKNLATMREQLVASETKVEALERVSSAQETKLAALNTEVAVLMTKLAASETEVVNLRKETAGQTADLRSVTERLVSTKTDIEHMKKDTAAQHADLTTMKTDIIKLKTDTAAQETRLSAGEIEAAAQALELTAVKVRLAATESDVMNLEREIKEQPKVAFSAALAHSGYIKAGNTALNLVFPKIITNVGQAYSSTTGFFTAPIRGVYYFRFTLMDRMSSRWMNCEMFKNGERVIHISDYDTDGQNTYLTNGIFLQLDVGDVVNMRIPAGYSLYDDASNRNTFSGFLLFPL